MKILLLMIILLPGILFAYEKSICGPTDERELSQNKKVGRVYQNGGESVCTVTLIGKKCAISAGHCRWTFNSAEFNTPLSRGGRMAHSDPKDIYKIDEDSIYYHNNGPGDDFAVMKLRENDITGLYPGEVLGHYEVSFEAPKEGDVIRITGHGRDTRDNRNFAQQTHAAPIARLYQSTIQHVADTKFGNSGSSIVDEITQKIIGIHTHGACYASGGSNYGTLFYGHIRLRQAIRNCLASE